MTDSTELSPNARAFSDPAERRLIINYVEGGHGDAPARNERDWQRWRVVPRAFADVSQVDTRASILGAVAAGPILVAPTHGHLLLHDDGEAATAAGARAAGVPFVLSQGAGVPFARIGGSFSQQLYLPRDRSAITPFVDAAVTAGATALIVTVDQAAAGGDPFRGEAESVLARVPSPNLATPASGVFEPSRNIRPKDLTWLAERWGLPVFAKGILDRDSAHAAVDAGIAGVIVSNHGGRQLAHTVSPSHVLAGIVDAVGSAAAVWADSGVRSGSDVFRALALGADAVLIGRPVLRALSFGGAAAVASTLRGILDDLRVVMANAGTPTVAAIDRKRVRDVER